MYSYLVYERMKIDHLKQRSIRVPVSPSIYFIHYLILILLDLLLYYYNIVNWVYYIAWVY